MSSGLGPKFVNWDFLFPGEPGKLLAMGDYEEEPLLLRCRQGEAAAWDELFEAHYAPVARFVFQLASDFTLEDVEEVCQETFLTVIKSLRDFQAECRFQTWLFRIATNKAHDYRERSHAQKRGGGQRPLSLEAQDPETGLTVDPPSALPGPDDQLLAAEKLVLVSLAVHQLEAPCRELVELRYFGDLSYEEIGHSMKLHPKTVSSRLSRCLDRLEPLLRRLFSGEKTPLFPV
jgi:RNA polymerase sigma-70 factor, ECF subfamily